MARKRRKAEDDHSTFTSPFQGSLNHWQTKKHGKLHGTVWSGAKIGRSAGVGGPRASVPKAPGRGGGGNLDDRDALKALYMQKKRRR